MRNSSGGPKWGARVTINLNDLATFVRVAELGTFSAAAAAEGVPSSTISRRVARLEDDLGVELLRRAARSFNLTEDGRSLHARAIGGLRELEEAAKALTDRLEEPSGRLVVTAPEDLCTAPAVVDLLAAYTERHDEVELELRLLDRFADLVAEDIDVALRVHLTEVVPGDGALMARKLGVLQAALYAAPSYVDRHGAPDAPEGLASHPFVVHSTLAGPTVELNRDDGRTERLDVAKTRFASGSMHVVAAMIERGLGVGPLPRFAAEAAVREGRLVRLLPAWWIRAATLTLLWPSSRNMAPRVRAFLELASERLTVGRWMCIE